MMKISRGILTWGFLVALAVGALWADRQSQTLAQRWAGPAVRLAESRNGDRSPFHHMTYGQVEAIFRERLRAYPVSEASKLAVHLIEECRRHALKPTLVLGLIKAESGFRANAVSHRGAMGLMQIMPDTARFISEKWGVPYRDKQDLTNPYTNISMGVTYLAYLRDKYRGSLHHVLAAYNIGPGRVDQLVAANRFKVVKTKPYIDSIREGVTMFRDYGRRILEPIIDPLLEAMDSNTLTVDARDPNV